MTKTSRVSARQPVQGLPWYAVLLVAAVALAASVAGISNELTLDDIPLIRDNERLRGLSHWREILTLPYWPPPAIPDFYRPLTSLLLAVQYGLGWGDPVVFRVGSYALYAVASVGVLRLASRLCSPYTALAIAVIFAAHPVHVEAVAGAVGQAEILVSIFAVLMVLFYVRGRAQPGGRLGARQWGLLATLYFGGSLAKEQGLLLPGLLVAAEVFIVATTPLRDRLRALWKGYAALATIGVLVFLIRTAVLSGHLAPPVTGEALQGVGFAGRALTLLQIVPEWLRLLVWPAHLRVEYRPQEFVASTSFGYREAVGLAFVISAVGIAWISRRRAPLITFGIAWLAIALFPVSNLVFPTFILIAERTLFLPSVGFLLALGGAVDFCMAHLSSRSSMRYHFVAIAAGLLVLAGLARSALRHRVWRTQETLIYASVRDSPRNWHAWQGLGDILFDAQQSGDAVRAYSRAIELAPEAWRVRTDYARRLRLIQADSEAVRQLRLSLAENPEQIIALAQLPPALIAVGDYEAARRLADSIIRVANAPPLMLWLRHVADSAIAVKAPPGSIRIGIGMQR